MRVIVTNPVLQKIVTRKQIHCASLNNFRNIQSAIQWYWADFPQQLKEIPPLKFFIATFMNKQNFNITYL
jgi:hypothetical protein